MKGMYRGIFLSRPSSCSRHTKTTPYPVSIGPDGSRTVPQGGFPLPCAVVSEAGRDDFHQCLACMGNYRNAPVFFAGKPNRLVVKNLDGCIFLKGIDGRILSLLRGITRFPNNWYVRGGRV